MLTLLLLALAAPTTQPASRPASRPVTTRPARVVTTKPARAVKPQPLDVRTVREAIARGEVLEGMNTRQAGAAMQGAKQTVRRLPDGLTEITYRLMEEEERPTRWTEEDRYYYRRNHPGRAQQLPDVMIVKVVRKQLRVTYERGVAVIVEDQTAVENAKLEAERGD